jgi:hypothetical protein
VVYYGRHTSGVACPFVIERQSNAPARPQARSDEQLKNNARSELARSSRRRGGMDGARSGRSAAAAIPVVPLALS